MNKKEIAKTLLERSLAAGHSEKLIPEDFEANDAYKVCYRFLSNMTTRWKELGLDHFPTEQDAVEVAKMAHPYFVWLFKNEDDGLGQFKRLYEFFEDIRR